MNKEAIRKTAICYWSKENETYVVESPLFETIAGVGRTEKASRKIFDNLLDDAYEAYLEGRVPGYEKAGRPTKGCIALNADVKPETKEFIKDLASNFKCSQGEIVDFLSLTYQKQKENQSFSYTNISSKSNSKEQWLSVCEKMDDLRNSLYQLETELPVELAHQPKSTPSRKLSNFNKKKPVSKKRER